MNTENHITLPDGRTLSYAEFGKRDGHPVLYFHGAPSSRLEPLLIGDDALGAAGLRVIAPDRPGMGDSTFQPHRGFSDWPRDVIALAEALGLGRFAVLGYSGGGGYAAVCAAKIPDRLSAVVIVSGGWRMDLPEATDNLPLLNRLIWVFASKAPFLLRLLVTAMGAMSGGERDKQLEGFKKNFHPADYAAIEQPGRLEAFTQILKHSLQQGSKGPAWDMRLYVREFDFRLEEIRIPLTLFHGEQDINAPIALVRKMVTALPSASLVTYESEAHISTLCNHLEEFARVIIEGDVQSNPSYELRRL